MMADEEKADVAPDTPGGPAPKSGSEAVLDAVIAHGTGTKFGVSGGWVLGILALVGLVVLVLHFSDLEAFTRALADAEPIWLAGAGVCQIATYLCAAAIWGRVLKRAGTTLGMSSLLRLALLELFANQAIPTGGLSGSIIVVRGLIRRSIAPEVAVTALVVAVLSYYAAYLLVGACAFAVLWSMGDLSPTWTSLSAVFLGVIVALATAVLALTKSKGRFIPAVVAGWAPLARLTTMLANVRMDILQDGKLIFEAVALQACMFLLDATTLWCATRAVGLALDPSTVFVSFMMGSVVSTLSPVPMGLGTFEAACTAMLHFMGGSVEASLAATLILRSFTLWLPMLPGLWLMHTETRHAGASGTAAARAKD